jgi:hypothetical protein
MTRCHNNKVPAWLLLFVACLLLAAMTGCERKVEGTVAVQDTVSDQCFNCHNGQFDAQQGEWVNSVHASGANVDYTSRDGSDCVRCHNQEGFIAWINTGTILASAGNAKAIGCFTCHNPHEFGDMRRRTEAPVNMPSGAVFDVGRANLCATCHQARSVPVITDNYTITSSRFGPHHGPQGDLLIATAGYTGFTGFAAGNTLHKDVITNGCVGCHMNYANTHEGYDVGGHSFNMKDEAGNSLAADCKASGCHDAGALAFSNPTSGEVFDYKLTTGAVDWDDDGVVEGYQTEMEGMLDSLRTLLDLQNIYNPATGLAVTGTYADGDLVGAYWNFITIEEDRSLGIHNWEYCAKLIEASRDYVATLPIP